MFRHFTLLLVVLLCWCTTTSTSRQLHSGQGGSLAPPLQLEDFGLLEQLAVLDEHLDPESQLWTQLLEPMLKPRYVGTEAHSHVRQHIVSVLTALGWHVDGDSTFQMTTPLGERNFTNVVATHDRAAQRRLLLVCHYDSIYGRDAFVAATDSAVPCAMMLYLATLMTHAYLDPTRGRSPVSLQLVFLDGEEAFVHWTDTDSIYGARHLAEQMAGKEGATAADALTELGKIDLFVLLDLLGAAAPKIVNYQSATNRQFQHLSSVEDKLTEAGLLSAHVPKIFHYKESFGAWGPPQISDDHLPFLHRGVPVLHLIPSPFPSVWHTDGDNATAVHFPTVRNLNRILRVFVAEHLRLPSYL